MTARAPHVDGLAMQNMQSPTQFSMQGARPSPLDLSDATPRRIPKLAVRHKSPDDTGVNEASQSSEESHSEIQTSWPGQAHAFPNIDGTSSNPVVRAQQGHHRQDSNASNFSEAQFRGRHPTKRKSAGVLGFFTLKEPSTSALDQYAEQERKRAAQKGATSVATVMPGVSSQKLPEHVPKVNSKWDGLPESARRSLRDKGRDVERENKRSSIISFGSADSPRRPYGSLSSKPHARQSQEKKRTAVRVTEVEPSRPNSARTLYSPPPLATTHPALRRANQVELQTFLHSSSPPPGCYPELDSTLPPALLSSEIPNLQERDYSSGTATSPDASPRTPALDFVTTPMMKDTSRTQSPSAADEPMGTFWLSDSENVIVKTAGPDVLKPPVNLAAQGARQVVNRPDSIEPISEEGLPATETGSAHLRPGMVRNFSHVSKYYQRMDSHGSGLSSHSSAAATSPMQSPTFSSAPSRSTRPTTMQSSVGSKQETSSPPSRAQASSASSESSGMSAQWRSPPKDRLSLGPQMKSQVKKNEVLPWEMFEPPPQTKAKSSSGDTGKLKRLSYRFGRK